MKQDRRSQRTRQLLNDALVALMLEKNYDAITVNEIIARANIGRSTFYGHFYDKDDLLAGNIERLMRSLGQRPAAGPSGFDSAALFEHIHAQRALFKALARGGGLAIALKASQRVMVAVIERSLAERAGPGQPAVPLPALAQYLAATFIALLRWWLDNDLPYAPAELEAMYQTLVAPGLERALAPASHSRQITHRRCLHPRRHPPRPVRPTTSPRRSDR
ncbi:MAG TPA: TetR/AcrR family transcriptional regulator [Herpetosiphonaceae bacterium]|nr:TetR/AcrR family transcriptional regulator [Herpetosiphonaceae bacterium]